MKANKWLPILNFIVSILLMRVKYVITQDWKQGYHDSDGYYHGRRIHGYWDEYQLQGWFFPFKNDWDKPNWKIITRKRKYHLL